MKEEIGIFEPWSFIDSSDHIFRPDFAATLAVLHNCTPMHSFIGQRAHPDSTTTVTIHPTLAPPMFYL